MDYRTVIFWIHIKQYKNLLFLLLFSLFLYLFSFSSVWGVGGLIRVWNIFVSILFRFYQRWKQTFWIQKHPKRFFDKSRFHGTSKWETRKCFQSSWFPKLCRKYTVDKQLMKRKKSGWSKNKQQNLRTIDSGKNVDVPIKGRCFGNGFSFISFSFLANNLRGISTSFL